MRDDDELRARGHLADLIREASDVRLIERRINFVQQAEGRRAIVKDAEHERERRHSFFAARQKQHILKTFARRLRDNIYAGL